MSRLTPHLPRLLALGLAVVAAVVAYALQHSRAATPAKASGGAVAAAPRSASDPRSGAVRLTQAHRHREPRSHGPTLATHGVRTSVRRQAPTPSVAMPASRAVREAPAPARPRVAPVRRHGEQIVVGKRKPARRKTDKRKPAPEPDVSLPLDDSPAPTAPKPAPAGPQPPAAPPAAAAPPAQGPSSAPVDTPPPATSPAPDPGTADPEEGMDDTDVGTLDQSGLPAPVDETPPPPS